MRQFHSPRARAMRLRHKLIPVAAIALVCGAVSMLSGQDDALPEPPVVVAAAPVVMIPATKPNIIARESAPAASLKAAFEETPQKPRAVLAALPEPTLADGGIASLRKGIGSLIDAGSRLMTSNKTLSVGRGDTLMDILVRNRVPRDEAHEAITALAKVYDPKDLSPGRKITVFFHEDPAIADPQFSGLSIEKDVVSTVRVDRDAGGAYKAEREDKPVHTETRGFRGVITDSLYVSAKAAGVPDGVILDLIKMYSFGVDFQRDIQGGDGFEIMYREEETATGETVPGSAEIVYARLTLSDRDMPFYLFKDASGDRDYYDAAGQGAKKPLMKTPIDGARLSSGFGMRRHPVLGYSKMHKGVDFAAPRGTPIYAAGDGVVVKAGPFSSYGKYVKIRHRNGLETAYAHMNAFKAGLRTGARVRQGQVIGYVGTTGRSTGPHLHYEVLLNGKQANPKTIKLAGGKALKGKDLKSFKAKAAEMDREFRTLGKDAAVALNDIDVGGAN